MACTTINYEVTDGIATLTLDRPDSLNAIDPAMERELLEVFDLIDADDAARAVVVTGRGRAFCAGADLSDAGAGFDVVRRAQMRGTEPVIDGDVPRDGGGMVNLRVFNCLKPVVAAVNGPAVGFGASFPLPMDVRLASETARFGFVFSRRGMSLDGAASWFLPRAVGMATALDWSLSGRIFDAQEALAAGLVRSVHPAEELLPAAREAAARLVADTAPVSVAVNRRLLWQMAGADGPLEAHRLESAYIARRASSADAVEGAQSFLDKRPAEFPLTVSSDMPAQFPWSSNG
jgi:enoyl-CoA hydratase/carnithine racemase